MVIYGQQYGLKAIRQAHLHRLWSVGAKSYSKQVSSAAAYIRPAERQKTMFKNRIFDQLQTMLFSSMTATLSE